MKGLLLLLLLLITGCTNTKDHVRQMFTEESDLVSPDTAQFRDISWNSTFSAWCGEVKAGGGGNQPGWQPFMISIRDGKAPFVTILSAELAAKDRIYYESVLEVHELYCSTAEPVADYIPFWSG